MMIVHAETYRWHMSEHAGTSANIAAIDGA